MKALGERTSKPEVLADARAAAEPLVSPVPAEQRVAMVAHVALYGALLG